MKKLLLASTALVATAGVASAQDIALSGFAEMGIFGGEDIDTQFFTDIDVTFTMSGEADNGLTFGANVDLDESDGGTDSCTLTDAPGLADNFAGGTEVCTIDASSGSFAAARQGGESIFVSFGGVTLTMGDTDGALDARVPEMALAGGSLADDETIHGGYDAGEAFEGGLLNSGDGQIARLDYAIGAITASLSAEQEANGADDSDDIFAVGFSYAANVGGVDLNAGIGYQAQEDNAEIVSVALTGGLANGLSLGVTYSAWDIDDDNTGALAGADDANHVGVGIGYTMNALAIGLNYGIYTIDEDDTSEGYGLAATYDLGGGFQLRAGYGYTETDIGGVEDDSDTFSLGARMNF
ncbi:outer membrane protein OmpU [Roseivivax lentus]|uniref:Outer membrane protein OmpU n=1 Tax=Roseivivax lentus TaxID=633194 RepID=A0A1N7K1T0_9RHOB|nr:porin [Roseivivax lentus]SIS55507.1 outer membrane protein OmpU [Roseivivax lentus]